MGIVQDSLAGIMLFTARDTFLTREAVMNLLMWVEGFDGRLVPPAVLKPKALWTGKQVMSMIIPKVSLLRDREDPDVQDRWLHPSDARVNIQKGELISGILCKKTVGASPGGLIHVVFAEKGPTKTRDFLSAIQ